MSTFWFRIESANNGPRSNPRQCLFYISSVIGTQPHPFTLVLSTAALCSNSEVKELWQETAWLAKVKIFHFAIYTNIKPLSCTSETNNVMSTIPQFLKKVKNIYLVFYKKCVMTPDLRLISICEDIFKSCSVTII